MSSATSNSGEQLAGTLHALGVKFIMGGKSEDQSLYEQPARLITALAESNESRLRLSLIPLFLEHPEFAVHVRIVAQSLNPTARLVLQCYYSAAVWLQQKYQSQKRTLPDHFSKRLHLRPGDDPEENLLKLANRQKELSGMRVNWLGTYEHAARRWMTHKKGN